MFKIFSTDICRINIKWGIQRVILGPSYIWDARFLKVKLTTLHKREHPQTLTRFQTHNTSSSSQDSSFLPFDWIFQAASCPEILQSIQSPYILRTKYPSHVMIVLQPTFFTKNGKSKLTRSLRCLRVYVGPAFPPLNHMTYFHRALYELYATGGQLKDERLTSSVQYKEHGGHANL